VVVLQGKVEERFDALNAIEVFLHAVFSEMPSQSVDSFAEHASCRLEFTFHTFQFQLQLVKGSAGGNEGRHRFFPVIIVGMMVQLRQHSLRCDELIQEILLVLVRILDIPQIIDHSFGVVQKEANGHMRRRNGNHSSMDRAPPIGDDESPPLMSALN